MEIEKLSSIDIIEKINKNNFLFISSKIPFNDFEDIINQYIEFTRNKEEYKK